LSLKREPIQGTVNEFLQTALSFPTVVYSVLLCVCGLYWLLAATGMAGDAFGDGGDAGDAGGAVLAGMGLAGVPVMVVATVLSFTGWLGTYYLHLLVLQHLPDGVRVLAGAGALLGVLLPAVAATSLVLRPLRRVLTRLRAEPALLGRSAVVITPTLDAGYGQAAVDDGGAGLILQVRHEDSTPLHRGDRIVLIEYLEGQNAYRVVPEQQFLSR
jgi:hypothetical protein